MFNYYSGAAGGETVELSEEVLDEVIACNYGKLKI